jgi:hypothetical protein
LHLLAQPRDVPRAQRRAIQARTRSTPAAAANYGAGRGHGYNAMLGAGELDPSALELDREDLQAHAGLTRPVLTSA